MIANAATTAADTALLLRLLAEHSQEVGELLGSAVNEVQGEPDEQTFWRQFVQPNRPVVMRGAAAHWPACHRWTRAYLERIAGDTLVSAQFTPNGRADAVTPLSAGNGSGGDECFCLPHSQRMTFSAFLSQLLDGDGDGGDSNAAPVPYLQQQNSNLRTELPQLLPDVEPQLQCAGAFGEAPPEAVNLWIGDSRSSTTFHRDHVENLYAVISGVKVFYLLPPTEVWRMGLRRYPVAQYEPDEGGRLVPVLQQPLSSVLWCPIDPQPSEDVAAAAAAAHPLFFDNRLPKRMRVEVHAGDVLYLPATWWHYVEQQVDEEQGWCVAVNAWHDMVFDSRAATYNLVAALGAAAGLLPHEAGDDSSNNCRGSPDSC